MTKNKIMVLSLLLLLLFVPNSSASDGDFTIPNATKNITVLDDGTTVITEEIVFDIEGSVNGVYRDIPLDEQQSLTNITVETPGYHNTVEVIENDDGKPRLKVWLYRDESQTQKIRDEEVHVIFKYNFNKGVKIYNDIAELQYMSWGNEWDSNVDELVTTINIPGSNANTELWNNPDDYVTSAYWQNDTTYVVKAENIPKNSSFEQRILMPKSYFKSYENAKVIHMDAKERIEAEQRNIKIIGIITVLFSGLIGVLMILPLGIYVLFGRETKINYKADYEYDLPTESLPIEVNSIVKNLVGVGHIDNDAMYATLLDLINRKFFKVISNNYDDTVLRLVNSNTNNLKEFEKSLVNFLSKFEINGDISLNSIADNCDPQEFKDFKESWIKDSEEITRQLRNEYFIDKGSDYWVTLALILFALSIIIPFVLEYNIFGLIKYDPIQIFAINMLMMFESIIMLITPETVPGKWTPEGKEYYDKWKNFQKYIEDFSLIKERPPASIQVWGKYLVYAAALGCADKVSENMKKYFDIAGVSEEYFNNSDAVMFAYYGGFNDLNSTVTALTPSDSSSDGGSDSGGGGFGGGGGGTF